MNSWPESIEVVDSHTEGEPTRLVIDGWPEVQGATMHERREYVRVHHDFLRRAVVQEPRGHDAVVGALLTEPVEHGSIAGVIFFNNAGYLGMCGHGLIGVVRSLEVLSRVAPGTVRIDTPVGTVSADLHDDGSVTLENVPAYVHALDVEVRVPELGALIGDVAWGGNWFFLTKLGSIELTVENVEPLRAATMAIASTLHAAGITGAGGAEIDHVELFGLPRDSAHNSRNFVLCPGGAYDRSPCGTGTSAKLAVLYQRGELELGQRWQQESVTGGLFTGWLTERDGALIPHIQGRAFETGRSRLVLDPRDPFRFGLR